MLLPLLMRLMRPLHVAAMALWEGAGQGRSGETQCLFLMWIAEAMD